MTQTTTTAVKPPPTTSSQFTVNIRDVLKGLAVAVLTPVFLIMIGSLEQGSWDFNWKNIGIVALSSFLGYILKNFLTAARIVITDPETVESVKKGDSTLKVVEKK